MGQVQDRTDLKPDECSRVCRELGPLSRGERGPGPGPPPKVALSTADDISVNDVLCVQHLVVELLLLWLWHHKLNRLSAEDRAATDASSMRVLAGNSEVRNLSARVSGRLMPGPEQQRHNPELFPEGEAMCYPTSMLSSIGYPEASSFGETMMTAKSPDSQEGVHIQKNTRPVCLVVRFPPGRLPLLAEEVACFFVLNKSQPSRMIRDPRNEGQKGPITRYLVSNLCAGKTRRVGLLRQIPLYGDLSGGSLLITAKAMLLDALSNMIFGINQTQGIKTVSKEQSSAAAGIEFVLPHHQLTSRYRGITYSAWQPPRASTLIPILPRLLGKLLITGDHPLSGIDLLQVDKPADSSTSSSYNKAWDIRKERQTYTSSEAQKSEKPGSFCQTYNTTMTNITSAGHIMPRG
ncbi:hypothetical protein B0T20DRAFT_388754 [Sordaria brevicollis]|uniref:Uncharacterized protein n=1 Tax=Sordaria brevicollis TaxID=83679 RepID=A0AAE0PP06_SORBR|nr:hypothetical protein B0T20DRAFT_388754 [Sordaria brevicollis]